MLKRSMRQACLGVLVTLNGVDPRTDAVQGFDPRTAMESMLGCGKPYLTSDAERLESLESLEEVAEDEETRERRMRKEAQWRSMFNISVKPNRERKHEFEQLNEAAKLVAESCLRDRVTLPANPQNTSEPWADISTGGRLPPVSCAFRHCSWHSGQVYIAPEAIRKQQEHPWDYLLREHVISEHGARLCELAAPLLDARRVDAQLYDIYLQALAVKERQGFPAVGPSIERRVFEHTQQIYNDASIRALICCLCARIQVDTGRGRSDIEFKHGGWFYALPPGSLRKNFSKAEFERRYQQIGSPLSACGSRVPDFTDWLLHAHPDVLATLPPGGSLEYLRDIPLLCCPEDHRCRHSCSELKLLCRSCEIPVCKECQHGLQNNEIVPIALSNDNWYGYVERWIYENDVTWMEKTCATPYWTGLMLFEIDVRRGAKGARKKHLMHDPLFSNEGRVAYKGQLFSAPMDWSSMMEQLQSMEKEETLISLPVTGAVLAQRVRLAITSGLTELNKCLKQATVRRNVAVQLIRMHRDANHPDYQRQSLRDIDLRARELAPTDEPAIPMGLLEILEERGEEEAFLGVDKAATPAERIFTEENLEREMERARPQILVVQRDSDASKDVEASRTNAFAQFSTLELRTGSALIDQFKTSYIPRVFNITLPWCVGGPDFPRQPRYRRTEEDAPAVGLDIWAAMTACRCEAQFRSDWDFNPGIMSLAFASKVNLSVSMSINRALRRGADGGMADRAIGGLPLFIF